MFLYAAHNLFNDQQHAAGYQLLKCIRAFRDLDMFASFEVHTEDTLVAGHTALKAFHDLMAVISLSWYSLWQVEEFIHLQEYLRMTTVSLMIQSQNWLLILILI